MPKTTEQTQNIIHLKERVTVYLTEQNPYLGKGRKAGDPVDVHPLVAKKGIEIGHYSEKKPKS